MPNVSSCCMRMRLWEQAQPAVLLVRRKHSQVLLQNLIDSLSLSIRLRMESCRQSNSDSNSSLTKSIDINTREARKLSRRMMTLTASNTRLCSHESLMAHKPLRSQLAHLSTAMTATHTHPMATDAYLMLSMEHDGEDVSLVHAKHSVVNSHCYP